MSHECNKLDAYLADDLSGDDSVRFERHLSSCEVCREAIDQQNWIDSMLRSSHRSQLEPIPSHLAKPSRTARTHSRRNALVAACGLASAAALLVAISHWQLNRQAMTDSNQTTSINRTAQTTRADEKKPPTATFIGGPDVIAVPVESHSPNVTVVRIYPTYRPPQDRETVAVHSNSATTSNWSSYSNGG
jgi:hypothetical protein